MIKTGVPCYLAHPKNQSIISKMMLTVPDGSIKDQEENETKLCIEEDEKDNKGFQLTHENRSQEGEDFIGHLLKVYPNEKL